MNARLSRPDSWGRRWTPCRTAYVVLQLRHGRLGGSQRDGYLVANVITGRNSQVWAFSAARDRAALYAQQNAESSAASVNLAEMVDAARAGGFPPCSSCRRRPMAPHGWGGRCSVCLGEPATT